MEAEKKQKLREHYSNKKQKKRGIEKIERKNDPRRTETERNRNNIENVSR